MTVPASLPVRRRARNSADAVPSAAPVRNLDHEFPNARPEGLPVEEWLERRPELMPAADKVRRDLVEWIRDCKREIAKRTRELRDLQVELSALRAVLESNVPKTPDDRARAAVELELEGIRPAAATDAPREVNGWVWPYGATVAEIHEAAMRAGPPAGWDPKPLGGAAPAAAPAKAKPSGRRSAKRRGGR